MPTLDEVVFVTYHNDGSADFTIRVNGDNHKFSTSIDGDTAELEYEESMSWLGVHRAGNPNQEVWRRLMQCDAMTNYLEEHELDAVRRKK